MCIYIHEGEQNESRNLGSSLRRNTKMTQPQLPISISRNDSAQLVIEVQENLNKLGKSVLATDENTFNRSIYRIPTFMREVHPKAFEPQLVSFGPYHHGKPQYASMELEKQKAFRRLKTNPEMLESIVQTVTDNLQNLLGAYDKLIEGEWAKRPAKFLEVLIVDGCFMLSFLKKCPPSLSSMSWDIKRDMLLLENQLPMLLLDDLYSILPNMVPPKLFKCLFLFKISFQFCF